MKLRVLLLADINSPHTQKWALGLAADNIEVGIFSLNHCHTNWHKNHPNITTLWQGKKNPSGSLLAKMSYLLTFPRLLRCLLRFRPSILHAHYASSYGLLGALCFHRHFIVSAWGSDVLQFPKISRLHQLIIRFVFLRAKKICVTSALLKKEIALYTRKACLVVPFGVDLNVFYDMHTSHGQVFTFGCIKHFEKIYNLDRVVLAFDLLVKKYPLRPMRLRLAGDGSQIKTIQRLVKGLCLEGIVEISGKIAHQNVPAYLNTLDVFINVSEYESFGVAVAEAMACKIPVIVSNTEGFYDLVPARENAIITNSTSVNDIFLAMETYLLNKERRLNAVKKSYDLVREKFNWLDNLKQMENVYFEFAESEFA